MEATACKQCGRGIVPGCKITDKCDGCLEACLLVGASPQACEWVRESWRKDVSQNETGGSH